MPRARCGQPGAFAAWVTGAPDRAGWLAIRLDLAGVLYTAAALVGGWNFASAGLRAARTLRLDMNFLMSAAIVGAVVIGEPFEAATLAFLFSLAELLERFAVDRGRRSIARLVELAPEQADRLRPDGTVEPVPTAQLRPGDRVRIRPGDKIPADGSVVAGTSAVNEATITGESLPRRKEVGDRVFASTLNTEGSLDVEVTADAAHSTLARIIQLARDTEARRAPIERLVERFARVYTPIVTVGAVLVMLVPPLVLAGDGLEWFVRGLTLLVIACPCALVIATPVTVVSALTSAARHGVLIKGGEHLEALGGVRGDAAAPPTGADDGARGEPWSRAAPPRARRGIRNPAPPRDCGRRGSGDVHPAHLARPARSLRPVRAPAGRVLRSVHEAHRRHRSPFKVAEIVDAVEADSTFPGMTVLDCRGFGREKTAPHRHVPNEDLKDFVERQAVLVAASDDGAVAVAQRLAQIARTGEPGDGKVFVLPLEAALRIATGETNERALR